MGAVETRPYLDSSEKEGKDSSILGIQAAVSVVHRETPAIAGGCTLSFQYKPTLSIPTTGRPAISRRERIAKVCKLRHEDIGHGKPVNVSSFAGSLSIGIFKALHTSGMAGLIRERNEASIRVLDDYLDSVIPGKFVRDKALELIERMNKGACGEFDFLYLFVFVSNILLPYGQFGVIRRWCKLSIFKLIVFL